MHRLEMIEIDTETRTMTVNIGDRLKSDIQNAKIQWDGDFFALSLVNFNYEKYQATFKYCSKLQVRNFQPEPRECLNFSFADPLHIGT